MPPGLGAACFRRLPHRPLLAESLLSAVSCPAPMQGSRGAFGGEAGGERGQQLCELCGAPVFQGLPLESHT